MLTGRTLVKKVFSQSIVGRWARPLLGPLYRRHIWQKGMGPLDGVYSSYEEAVRHVPPASPATWNETRLAAHMFGSGRPKRRAASNTELPILLWQPSTFAVMLWLGKLLRAGTHVVDVGGASGITYWHYKEYFDMPEGMTWTVVDMPEITTFGQKTAEQHGASNLKFVNSLASIDRCDVLVSLGAIQYMAPSDFREFVELAGSASATIINKMPLVDGPPYWTLESLQTSIVPYWIANRTAFLEEFDNVGLNVRDAWDVPELSIEIPFAPDYYVPVLKGIVLSGQS